MVNLRLVNLRIASAGDGRTMGGIQAASLLDRNPIKLVRQSAKREKVPEVLELFELQLLLSKLFVRERTLALLDAATGLRVSELLALRWSDVDFENLELNVTRSIWHQVVGNCKTEASAKPVPMDSYLWGYARLTDTRSLALLGDPSAEAYEILFSFSTPEEKARFLDMVRSNDELGNDYVETDLLRPTLDEIREARPIATVLPQVALVRASLVAATIFSGSNGDKFH